MDKLGRIIIKTAVCILFLVFLFPPFRLSNGQPVWGFIGNPPRVVNWITLDEIFSHNFQPAEIHWGFLVMEVFYIVMMAVSIWVSIHDDGHHQGH